MEKTIVKALSVLALVLFGFSLAACGKANDAEGKAQDQYTYTQEYSEYKCDDEDSYVQDLIRANGSFYFLEQVYIHDEASDYYSSAYQVKKFDIDSKEVEETITLSGLDQGFYLQNMTVLEDGSIVALGASYDENTYEETYGIANFAATGELVSISGLDGMGSSSYISGSYFANDGIVIIFDESIIKFSFDGKKAGEIKVQNWVNSFVILDNGKAYASMYSGNSDNMGLYPIKDDFSGIEDAVETDISLSNANLFAGNGNTILVSSNTGVNKLNLETGEKEELWSWLDMDSEASMDADFWENEDGTYTVYYTVWEDTGVEYTFVNLKKELVSAENTKKELVLGCIGLDQQMQMAIQKFNRNSSDYHIKVVDYSDETDSDAVLERFSTDINKGNVDIVEAGSYEGTILAGAGSLEDLSSYFENDPDIKPEDYFTNIFDAFKTDGAMYFITPMVSFETLAVSEDVAQGRNSWTLDDLCGLREEYPDSDFMEYASKETLLYMFLQCSTDEFYDAETQECYFNTEKFYKFLELLNTFPNEEDYDYSADYNSWEAIRTGEIKVVNLYISDADELKLYDTLMGGNLAIIGYPVSKGNGTTISAYTQLGISGKCSDKEGAWEFIKTFLKEDYQSSDEYSYNGFPVLKSAFEERIASDMKKETTVENGKTVEVSNSSWGNGYETVDLYALTENEADMIRNLMETADKTANSDEQIMSIISEEIQPYFKGQKSAEEIGDIVQSRVKIYLAEKN